MKLDLNEIATLLSSSLKGENRDVELLLTDSRSLTDPAKSLFFALRGPSNDGHRYILDLYSRGVRSFVVNEVPVSASEMPDASWII
ncbi:MAG: bifunctional UDP-N-acetylmuramoyl-tripeptide:D-alanyl-D-alanine ligase/alanine racemase, partial [Muribaculaceae bacterium]|nr:bifunctional UDP-N-acetylmuramoyl-tripeptide:D-alanyl-D-alanine ligase/alanine racemase [Muribaculaceae bacterium]